MASMGGAGSIRMIGGALVAVMAIQGGMSPVAIAQSNPGNAQGPAPSPVVELGQPQARDHLLTRSQ